MMKLTVGVKPAPDAVQAPVLERTLAAINEAANQVSKVAFEYFGSRASVRGLRSLCYGDLKARGLGGQIAQHVIKRVVDAYTGLRSNTRAGNLGREGNQRRRKAGSKPIGRDHDRTTTPALTAAGNNFELAIAAAIVTFGVTSGQALAGVVGPLIEVPVLIALAYASLAWRRRFAPARR